MLRQASSQGDLRHALEAVHFTVQGSVAEAPTAKRRKRPLSASPLPPAKLSSDGLVASGVCGRDVSYSLLHSVGKLLFGKADSSVERVIERAAVSPFTLLSFVQANYLRHLLADDDLQHTPQATEHLSTADVLAQQQRALTFGDVRSSHCTAQHLPLLHFHCCCSPPLLRCCAALLWSPTQTQSGSSDALPVIVACRSTAETGSSHLHSLCLHLHLHLQTHLHLQPLPSLSSHSSLSVGSVPVTSVVALLCRGFLLVKRSFEASLSSPPSPDSPHSSTASHAPAAATSLSTSAAPFSSSSPSSRLSRHLSERRRFAAIIAGESGPSLSAAAAKRTAAARAFGERPLPDDAVEQPGAAPPSLASSVTWWSETLPFRALIQPDHTCLSLLSAYSGGAGNSDSRTHQPRSALLDPLIERGEQQPTQQLRGSTRTAAASGAPASTFAADGEGTLSAAEELDQRRPDRPEPEQEDDIEEVD